MDTTFNFPAIHSPFQRRLSKMYSDTKQSYDTVTEPPKVDVTPELTTLFRKLRIQKDRLIAWGFEWSDTNAPQPGNIDESLDREGLSDVVGSVMSSIKDILREAERMRYSEPSTTIDPEKYGSSLKSESAIVKDRWQSVDRARFEDLLQQLTTSIDTLYGLSRSRSDSRRSRQAKGFDVAQPVTYLVPEISGSKGHASPLKLEEKVPPLPVPAPRLSARPGSSFQLDRSCLTIEPETRSSLQPPPYEVVPTPSSFRTMGYMKQSLTLNASWLRDGNNTPAMPVLIEYAPFDPIYSATEVYPSMSRLEKLAEALHQSDDVTMDSELRVLNMVGYFEDPGFHRFGLVYTIPDEISRGLSGQRIPLNALEPFTLLSILNIDTSPGSPSVPNLEDRFRLSYTISTTFLQLHNKGIVHQDVSSNNIIFFRSLQDMIASNRREPGRNLKRPYLCSFDVFSESNVEISPSMHIYRHPLDMRKDHHSRGGYRPSFDIYGLGLILLEIGLWMPLSSFWKQRYDLPTFKSRIVEIYAKKLGPKCGSIYMRAVESCLSAVDRDLADDRCGKIFNLQWSLYCDVVRRLEQCCAIDEGDLPELPASLRVPQPAINVKMPSEIASPEMKSLKPGPPPVSPLERISTQAVESQEASKAAQQIPAVPAEISEEGRVPTLNTGGRKIQVPFDSQAASRAAEDRLRRNAGASARFRQHRKEKEHETAQKIAQLEQQIRDLNASRTTEDKNPTSSSLRPDLQPALSSDKGPLETNREQRPSIAAQQSLAVRVRTSAEHLAESNSKSRNDTPKSNSKSRNDTPKSNSKSRNDTPKSNFKSKAQTIIVPPEQLKEWHQNLLPQLERLMEKALKDPKETFTIDLIANGETVQTSRPTICVTCSSVGTVRNVLSRRFNFDRTTFGLKVRAGMLRRSANKNARRKKRPLPRLSAADWDDSDQEAKNPFPQVRPLSGASIGACKREQHLPAVTFGGVILVDGEPYGMTVHHLLDYPSDDEDGQDEAEESPTRSSARALQGWSSQSFQQEMNNPFYSDADEAYSSDVSGADLSSIAESDWSDDEGASDDGESILSDTGDIPGVPKGEGEELIVTQPAIDDVELVCPNFFTENRNEEHLDSHELGCVYASSGIRRLKKTDGKHEIDWALLKIKDERLQPHNLIQGGRRYCPNGNLRCSSALLDPISRHPDFHPEEDLYPNEVANMYELGNLEVHCMGRTSGLETGVISPCMSSVRITGRRTASRSWRVIGGFGRAGDSGAWVIDNEEGRVCGHVLAWCSKNKWAYICPMQVLMEDIQHTLDAENVRLPDAVDDESCATDGGNISSTDQQEMVTTMVSNLRIASDSPVDIAERSGANMNIFQRSGGSGSWAN